MGWSCTKKAADKLAALKQVLCVGLSENSFLHRSSNEARTLITHIIEHDAEDERNGGITGQITICIGGFSAGSIPFLISGDGDLDGGCRFMQAAERYLEEDIWPTAFGELILDPEIE